MKRAPLAISAAWPLAVLVAIASLGGLIEPTLYARETDEWTRQAISQNWFDAFAAVPWLVAAGWYARCGSTRWTLVLAGTYAYVAYEGVIYAFSVHFNAMFLIYCAQLGCAVYALGGSWAELRTARHALSPRRDRLAGGFLVGTAVAFATLWLAEDVGALLHAQIPVSLVATGLPTNPVHVLDLALVLPAHVIAGVLVWRGHAAGRMLAAIVLAFGVPMAASIAMLLPPMGLVAVASGALALRVLRD